MSEDNFVLNLDKKLKGFDAKDIELNVAIIPDTFNIGDYTEKYISYNIYVLLELTTTDKRYPYWKYSTWLSYRHIWENKIDKRVLREYLLLDNEHKEACMLNKVIFKKEDQLDSIMSIARKDTSEMLHFAGHANPSPVFIADNIRKKKIY